MIKDTTELYIKDRKKDMEEKKGGKKRRQETNRKKKKNCEFLGGILKAGENIF